MVGGGLVDESVKFFFWSRVELYSGGDKGREVPGMKQQRLRNDCWGGG